MYWYYSTRFTFILIKYNIRFEPNHINKCINIIIFIYYQLCSDCIHTISAEHGLHNWLNTRPGGKDDIASMSLIDNDDNGSLILLDQSVCIVYLHAYIIHKYIFDMPISYLRWLYNICRYLERISCLWNINNNLCTIYAHKHI